MVLGTIAGVASAAGSIASAFGGSGYSRKRHADQLKIESNQRRLDARAMPKMMREGADLAGYHPLAVLGMNPASGGSSVSFGGSGSNGSALEAMGQGISRAAESYMSSDERAMLKAGAALDLQNKELSNEAQRLQNQRLASEIALSSQAGQPPGFDIDMTNHAASMFRYGVDPKTGDTIPIWNEEALGEGGELLQAYMFLNNTLPSLVKSKFNQSKRGFLTIPRALRKKLIYDRARTGSSHRSTRSRSSRFPF